MPAISEIRYPISYTVCSTRSKQYPTCLRLDCLETMLRLSKQVMDVATQNTKRFQSSQFL